MATSRFGQQRLALLRLPSLAAAEAGEHRDHRHAEHGGQGRRRERVDQRAESDQTHRSQPDGDAELQRQFRIADQHQQAHRGRDE